jgi:hypothetical protein
VAYLAAVRLWDTGRITHIPLAEWDADKYKIRADFVAVVTPPLRRDRRRKRVNKASQRRRHVHPSPGFRERVERDPQLAEPRFAPPSSPSRDQFRPDREEPR